MSTLLLALSAAPYMCVLTIIVGCRATATTPLSAPINGAASSTVAFTRDASLKFEVSGDYSDSDATVGPSAGDTIIYIFSLENNGTVTVWGAEISSWKGGKIECTPPLESLQLAPTNKTECASTHEVGQYLLVALACPRVLFDVTSFP